MGESTVSDETPLSDPIEEARRVVDTADSEGLTVRQIGGTAIYEQSETAREEPFKRPYRDVDFVSHREEEEAVKDLMLELGYESNKRFNTMRPHRLEFYDPENERKADYILDKFRFSHAWSLRDRLEIDHPTVPIEDLLLSKLQIAEISDRDMRDIIAMVNDHPIEEADGTDHIDTEYVADLCRDDWGLYKTITMNMDKVESYLVENELPVEDATIADRLGAIRESIETVPKTLKWRLRSLIGERKQWYRRPELS